MRIHEDCSSVRDTQTNNLAYLPRGFPGVCCPPPGARTGNDSAPENLISAFFLLLLFLFFFFSVHHPGTQSISCPRSFFISLSFHYRVRARTGVTSLPTNDRYPPPLQDYFIIYFILLQKILCAVVSAHHLGQQKKKKKRHGRTLRTAGGPLAVVRWKVAERTRRDKSQITKKKKTIPSHTMFNVQSSRFVMP